MVYMYRETTVNKQEWSSPNTGAITDDGFHAIWRDMFTQWWIEDLLSHIIKAVKIADKRHLKYLKVK